MARPCRLALALIALAAPAAAQPPHGVNGIVLGTEEAFSVQGPARVCLPLTSIDLRADERATLDYSGIHNAAIRVVGPHGSYLVREASWAEPRNPRLEEDWRGRTIARTLLHGRPRYLIYATFPDSRREEPIAGVEGEALGRSHDREILDRILIHPGGATGCRRRFNFGWDVISGQVPLDERENR